MIALGVDLGGTRNKIGVVDGGSVVAHEVVSARGAESLRDALAEIAGVCAGLLEKASVAPGGCAGVCLGFPGVVDPAGRIVRTFGKYDDSPGLDLRGWAKESLGLPLFIENDANLACLGEWRHGAGRGSDSVVMLTLGTGIGSSAIVCGTPLRGARGRAGNLGGHFVVRIGGRASIYGLRGIAEAEASQSVLPEIVRAHPGFPGSSLAGLGTIDYETVFAHAESGDAVAEEVIERSLEAWTAATINMVHAYDADVAILGGGIARHPRVVDTVRDAVERLTVSIGGRTATVVRAAEPEFAALLGAHVAVSRGVGG